MDFISSTNDDDPNFRALVKRVVAIYIAQAQPIDVFVIRIDHWFDSKWFAYAGNALGVVPVYKMKRLAVPPFIPGRVVSESAFALDAATDEYRKTEARSLHRSQRSSDNHQRYLDRVSRSGLFVWFSGDTKHNEHGSMMLYTIQDETQYCWYASFRRDEDWRLHHAVGISKREMKNMMEA